MSASDWEEVKKLAADFQRTQLATSLQRLSERNCIEIVKKLVSLNLIEVIFTCDGKEYITPDHLVREIGDEVAISSGRVHLSDLVSSLNVDYSHIEAKGAELAKESYGEITLVLGQLVSSEYKDRLADEVNEKLSQLGVITIGELTKSYDLPAEFLEEIIICRLGTTIRGVQDVNDPRTIFTESYLNQYKARIRGILSAITRPTPLSQLINKYKFPEKIFNASLDALVKDGLVAGTVSLGGMKTYIPDIYARTQRDWVDSFYKQNGYLEYDSMARIGISDPKSFASKRFSDLIFLKSCCVSNTLLYQLDSTIEECISNKNWADLQPLLPSVLNEKDIKELFVKCVEGNKSLDACSLLCNTIVVSNAYSEAVILPMEELMTKKAEADLKSGTLFKVFASQQVARDKDMGGDAGKLSKKDERKKKASTSQKTGGGTQGREVKIKATKKKYNPNQKDFKDDDSEEDDSRGGSKQKQDSSDLIFLTVNELAAKLNTIDKTLKDGPENLAESIAKKLFSPLTAKYLEVAKTVFLATTAADGASQKKTHTELQSSLNSLNSSIYMYTRGLETLSSNEALQGQLTKFLQKSLCTDVVSLIVNYLSAEENPNLTNPEARVKSINKLDQDVKEPLLKLNASLNSSNLEEFFPNLEEVASKCDILIKAVDKKKEKLLLSESRQNHVHQLNETADKALLLHLAVLLLFQEIHKQLIHAPGKFVPQIIAFLKPNLEHETVGLLMECEQLVIRQIKLDKDGDADEKLEVDQKLSEFAEKLKAKVLAPKGKEN